MVGSTRGPPELLSVAEEVGAGLIDAEFRLVTGGLGGVMEAASRGARGASRWTEGAIIGVLPGLVAEEANPFVDVVVPTGMSFARNVVVVAMADVVIAIGGGAGTLSEIALAWQHNRPVVAVDLGEGWSARLAGEALDHRRSDVLHRARGASEAVELARSLAGTREPNRGF